MCYIVKLLSSDVSLVVPVMGLSCPLGRLEAPQLLVLAMEQLHLSEPLVVADLPVDTCMPPQEHTDLIVALPPSVEEVRVADTHRCSELHAGQQRWLTSSAWRQQ